MKKFTIIALAMVTLLGSFAFAGKPILWGPVRAAALQIVTSDAGVNQLMAEGYSLKAIHMKPFHHVHNPPHSYTWGNVVFTFVKTETFPVYHEIPATVTVTIVIKRENGCTSIHPSGLSINR